MLKTEHSCINHRLFHYVFLQHCVPTKRPVWFVFAGMGSQWPGMARDMLHVHVFKQSLLKSDAVLKQYDVELMKIIGEGNGDTFQNPVNAFVTITSIQV